MGYRSHEVRVWVESESPGNRAGEQSRSGRCRRKGRLSDAPACGIHKPVEAEGQGRLDRGRGRVDELDWGRIVTCYEQRSLEVGQSWCMGWAWCRTCGRRLWRRGFYWRWKRKIPSGICGGCWRRMTVVLADSVPPSLEFSWILRLLDAFRGNTGRWSFYSL